MPERVSQVSSPVGLHRVLDPRGAALPQAARRIDARPEIWPDELESFEQAFLTGTAAEVTPVGSIGPWNFEVGDLTRQLAKDYDDLVYGHLPND